MRRRYWFLIVGCTVVLLGGALLLSLVSLVTRQTPHVRDLVVTSLNERFRSRVEMDSLAVDAFPKPAISGTGLRLRHNGRTDVEPLISIESFSADTGLVALAYAPPLRLDLVELQGMDIRIPPGGFKPKDPNAPDQRRVLIANVPQTIAPPRRRWLPFRKQGGPPLFINRIVATRATLEITPGDITKLPRIFEIHNLELRDFGGDAASAFTASLENPKPAGRIEIAGSFGPWQPDDPRLTAISGNYVFKNADLNTIKGIAGILSSEGKYSGSLERIEVVGTTDVPDFRIDVTGTPVHLMTKYRAIVDGTNGNTYLEQVDSQIGDTVLHTKGAVVRAKDAKGRHTTLDVQIDKGRIEDLLKLAVKTAKPIMTGRIDLKTKFVLPAGEASVIEKLQLAGTFNLAQAKFTNVDVQKKITMLSQKGRGDEDGTDGESIVSNLTGQFVLQNASLRFENLTFNVPGAKVQLAGTYNLRDEMIDFKGELLTDASLADMTSGYKSVLARIAQPFFRRKGGGSTFPIKIQGPRNKPAFGLDIKRAFLPG